ncbi:MAG: nucleotidyltransferase domain-containing protein [Nitrospirae bacterium]|uniref:nucleotidyltransferase domain-containing protein n=1 Tax=Candidatus Magnetobacterium casense TaxID=1455061 RepID=UPI0005916EBA|nr:nucleotidyltransferase domain-containing protein [Candidatus Magnetobacterium casensis]MBF0336998.1 nucleotidyltransferase domain-containing protein [Nitrospirota bacterium]
MHQNIDIYKKQKAIVVDEFKKNINNSFKNNVVFAFLCGSFAMGKSTSKSDIDILVCLKKRDMKMEEMFLKWYFYIHEKTGHIPDHIYNYEVCNQNQLNLFLTYVEKAVPTIKINSLRIYTGIVLAGMLSSTAIGFIGDHKKYLPFRKRAHEITKRWKQQTLKFLSVMDTNSFLRRVIIYERDSI